MSRAGVAVSGYIRKLSRGLESPPASWILPHQASKVNSKPAPRANWQSAWRWVPYAPGTPIMYG